MYTDLRFIYRVPCSYMRLLSLMNSCRSGDIAVMLLVRTVSPAGEVFSNC